MTEEQYKFYEYYRLKKTSFVFDIKTIIRLLRNLNVVLIAFDEFIAESV